MVRITAIKININIVRLIFTFLLFLGLIIFLKFMILSNFSFNNIVESISTNFFKRAIESTVITSKHDYDNNIQIKTFGIYVQSGFEHLIGFNIKKPQTVFSRELSLIAVHEKSKHLIGIPESKYDVDENYEIILPDQEEKKDDKFLTEPEIETKESITKEKGVTLINETNYVVNLSSMIDSSLKIKGDKKDPQVLIYHTHTCESYTSSPKYKYVPSDNDRTNDLDFSVARVGDQLSKELKRYGIRVLHDKTIHDLDEYNRAYSKSEKTLQGYIKKYPSLSLIIDLHRDAANTNGNKLRVYTTIDKKPVASVMTVIGTDGRGLPHPYWRDNLKLGVNFIYKMNEMYPGLGRGVNLQLGRFNQYYSKNAILIEVGGNGNTLDEALESTKYIAKVIDKIVN